MTAPVRLRLSRGKRFDLQWHSRNTNGLPAVNVARPGRWGNPFRIGEPGIPDATAAVAAFRELLGPQPANVARLYVPRELIRRDLRGKNLACWCKPGAPCHADVLLEIANGPACEEGRVIYIRFITPYNRDNFAGYLPGIPRVGDTILHPDTGEWRVTSVEWMVLKGSRPGDCHVRIEKAD